MTRAVNVGDSRDEIIGRIQGIQKIQRIQNIQRIQEAAVTAAGERHLGCVITDRDR